MTFIQFIVCVWFKCIANIRVFPSSDAMMLLQCVTKNNICVFVPHHLSVYWDAFGIC